jgi:protein-S-isoprenylcysteine O-methyltransferase Ste14
MHDDQTFRTVLMIGALILVPIMLYYRLRSQATGESLDRWQEGRSILFTLRPIGAALAGSLAFTLMIVRTRVEEEHLRARFGDPYRTYAESTGRLHPRRSERRKH